VKPKPPAPGAVRVYPLVLSAVDDVVATAMQRYRHRGWTVIETGYTVQLGDPYTQVTLWAVPPRIES